MPKPLGSPELPIAQDVCAQLTVHVLVVGPGEREKKVAAELDTGLGRIMVQHADNPAQARVSARQLAAQPGEALIPLVIVSSEVGDIDKAISEMVAEPSLAKARYMLITDRQRHQDLAKCVDQGWLVAVVGRPWLGELLIWHAESQIDRWLRRHRPDDPCTADLVASGETPAQAERAAVGETGQLNGADDLLTNLELDSAEMVQLLVVGIERALGPRAILELPAGVRLTRQGQPVDAVYLVLSGSVALQRSLDDDTNVLLHHASSGPIIGLVSMAQRDRATFTAKTTTAVEVVRISIEQVDHVLLKEPEMSAMLAVLAISALTTRLVRAEQLHIEKAMLTNQLRQERAALAATLAELEDARGQLVGQARFAALGELAAGVAHELNNPVAALTRAAEFAGSDIEKLLAATPGADRSLTEVKKSRSRRPRSTRDERAIIRQLRAEVGDRDLAKRMMQAGITDVAEARELAAAPDREQRLVLLEAAVGVGRALHNIDVASLRISEIVKSLRAYARPDDITVADVDVHEGIDDTLALTGHRLRHLKVVRDYGDLSPIRCYPSQLGQVWTNLLVNAAEAMEDGGTVTIRTRQPDPLHVQVSIIDDGPGIPAELLPKIFEPHFSTKSGRVRFGLGMGLELCRRFVGNNGGQIVARSHPGRTEMTVTLPVAGPTDEGEKP